MAKGGAACQQRKKRAISGKTKTQIMYYLMLVVPAIWMFVFSYIPMAGTYLAFIDYKPAKGIFGSKFVGLAHFKKFFASVDFERVFRNTLLYNVASIVLVSLFAGMLFAILLYEIRSRMATKVFQTCMLLPAFLSWTVVSAALMLMIHPDNGMLNKLLSALGMAEIKWYQEAKYWPYIIVFCMFYKNAGISSIYFYAALLSIDPELFSAAKLDGASRLKQIRYITLPALSKVFCITLITNVGSILASGLSPFYELTLNQGALYETTQVIGTYLYNGVTAGRFSFSAAVSLVQSLIGLILVLVTNAVVNKVDPESAMF